MTIIQGFEDVINPLQQSQLHKKGLCDYVINVASGCIHGCTFCYVPSTPVIRTRQSELREKGVNDPQMDWGKYLFIRKDVPEKLETILSRTKKWHETPAGKGVVLLCSGTDPYQNAQTAEITRSVVRTLLKHGKKVRILTRGLSWINDLDILVHPNVTVGVSLPHLNDTLSRQIEPASPPPSFRFKALLEGYKAGCRLYIAAAPTAPQTTSENFTQFLEKIMEIEPEVIFWEPINARGTNGKRMLAAGLDFIESVMSQKAWSQDFIKQWNNFEKAASVIGCLDRLHIWPDKGLQGFIDSDILEYWWDRPTIEQWYDYKEQQKPISDQIRPSVIEYVE